MNEPIIDDIGRIMTPNEQLELWVSGKLVHNGNTRLEGECCPDFSCCNGNPWPKEQRITFRDASEQERLFMLFGGLSNLLNKDDEDPKVYIAGLGPEGSA